MNWGNSIWLYGLPGLGVVALGLLVLGFLKRRQSAVRWPGIRRVTADGAHVRTISPQRALRRPWLLLLAITAVLVSLARPRWGTIEERVVEQSREVMIALDLSRSMLVEDVPPSRLERARLLVQGLLSGLRGERAGLIVFAGTAFVQVPLSADYQILSEFLPGLNPEFMPQGGTNYPAMLREALGGFSETPNTDRFLIVLSDGESTAEGWREQIDQLRERGVHVISLGVGTASGGFIPDAKSGFVKDERGAVVLSKLEPSTLQTLANETGGTYRDASQFLDLPAVLQETVERGKQGLFTEQKSVRHIERYQWFLAPAVLFALLGLWREISVRPRPRAVRVSKTGANISASIAVAAPRATRPAAVAASSLLVIAVVLAGSARALEKAAPTTDAAGRVREMVARVASAQNPRATDWREIAQRTLVYANDAKLNSRPVEQGAIRDALSAVDTGEKLDRGAANWTQLREDLKKFLENPPPQQEQQQDQKPPPQKQENQDKSDQQKQEQDKQEQKNEQDKQNEKQSGSQQQQQNQNDQQQQQDSEKRNSSANPSEPKQGSSQPEDSMGALKEDQKNEKQQQQPAAPQPDESAGKTRKIVGQPANENQPPANPENAAALQALRQVMDRDSPARLFELLESAEGQPPKSGPDW